MPTATQLHLFEPDSYEKAIEANFESFLKSASVPLPILASLVLVFFTGHGQIKAFGFDVDQELGARVLGATVIVLAVYLSRCLRIMSGLFSWLEKYYRDQIDIAKLPDQRNPEFVDDLQIPIKLRVRNHPSMFNIFMLPVDGSDIGQSKYLGVWSFSLLFGISSIVISLFLFKQGLTVLQGGLPSDISQWMSQLTKLLDWFLLLGVGYSYGAFHRNANAALFKFVGGPETKTRNRILATGGLIPLFYGLIFYWH
jgi:hypothetical protein